MVLLVWVGLQSRVEVVEEWAQHTLLCRGARADLLGGGEVGTKLNCS